MNTEELIAWRAKEAAFAKTPLGALFFKYKAALTNACYADAKFEYLDQGEKAARSAWAKADEIEKEFRALLEPRS